VTNTPEDNKEFQ